MIVRPVSQPTSTSKVVGLNRLVSWAHEHDPAPAIGENINWNVCRRSYFCRFLDLWFVDLLKVTVWTTEVFFLANTQHGDICHSPCDSKSPLLNTDKFWFDLSKMDASHFLGDTPSCVMTSMVNVSCLNLVKHPAWGSLTSDWSGNHFTIVVYEFFIIQVQS